MKRPTYLITILVFSLVQNTCSAETGQNTVDKLYRSLQTVPRDIPRPAPRHPGNIFVLGENVTIPITGRIKEKVKTYRVLNEKQNIVQEKSIEQTSDRLELGKLGIGWYRIEFIDKKDKILDWTTSAVIHPLAEAVPQDSPICIDSATAWFAKNNPTKQENFARLAALAGANWIRDRLTWKEIQKTPDTFVPKTTYDASADLQTKHGLKVLQVFHHTPGWAHNRELDGSGAGSRFPRDLRLLYTFCREMAQRTQGKILAWEPWNEANITVFGGHTIDEMCSHQKAAYLGFKAGNPDLTVCWNTYAGSGTPLHTEGILLNEAWPYFETYNIHTYHKPDQYLDQFATACEAACGRPIWLSECGIGLKYLPDARNHELSCENELRQAKFIARSYASSLFAGINRHFFFILGNYPERGVQFGLLRHDLTPRPGYVAYAAVARFLAGAKPLGRYISHNNNDLRLYAFRSRFCALERDILIIWAEKPTVWKLPATIEPETIYDYLGRPLKKLPNQLNTEAMFVILPLGQAKKLNLEPPKRSSAYRTGKTSPVVLQLQMPHTVTNLDRQAHVVDIGRAVPVKLFAYNFAEREIEAMFHVEHCPNNWDIEPRNWNIRLKPMERKALPLRVTLPVQGRNVAMGQWLRIRGDLANGDQSVLAFRLMGDMKTLEPKEKLSWPEEVEEIQYFCSADQSQQPAMFFAPKLDKPKPLLVGLHTWSADYRQRDPGVYYARWCVEKDWAFIHPNFRGPNKRPQATGSEFVVQDILDSVIYSKKKVNIDTDRIYIIGTSGGGYTALLMAGRAPEIWAGVSAWVPIVDLAAWHQESIERTNRYIAMIEASVGGAPAAGTKAYEECVKRSPITYLKNAQGLPLDINAGINDGHKGSVPVSHSLRAFNCVADVKDKILDAEINYFVQKAKVPDSLQKPVLDLIYGKKKPLFRRTSGMTRITIFNGGHEIVPQAALNWLAKQSKTKEAVNHK